MALPGPRAPASLQGPELLVEAARAAEARGFDAAWVTDHPFPAVESGRDGHQAHDPFVAMAYVAAATTRLRLHASLIVLPYRNPFIVARAAASLDHLSGGRLILGIGAGYAELEFAALGSDFETRERQTEEGVEAMKAAWTGAPVELASPTWTARGNSMLPRPAQRPHPPLWRGGNGPVAIAHAVRACDGWTPFELAAARAPVTRTTALDTLDALRAKLALLRRLERDAGRSDALDICLVRPRSTWYGRPDDEIREELAELEALGVTWIAAQLEDAGSPAEYFEQLERVATLAGLARARA